MTAISYLLWLLILVGTTTHATTLLTGHIWWASDLVSHMQLQILLGLTVLYPLLWRLLRSRLLIAIACLHLGVLGLWVLGGSVFVTTTPTDTFDLYFHNTLYYQNIGGHERMATLIAQTPAQVYALVESHPDLVTELAKQTNADIALVHDELGLSCAVLTTPTAPAVLDSQVILDNDYDPICIVRFDTYDLYVIHPAPPTNLNKFRRQTVYFDRIVELIDDSTQNNRPWVVAGDFNSTMYSQHMRQRFGQYDPQRIYSWAWPAVLTMPIDYIFGSSELNVLRLPRGESDHHGLGVHFAN